MMIYNWYSDVMELLEPYYFELATEDILHKIQYILDEFVQYIEYNGDALYYETGDRIERLVPVMNGSIINIVMEI